MRSLVFLFSAFLANTLSSFSSEINWDDEKIHPTRQLDMTNDYGYQFSHHGQFGKEVMNKLVETCMDLIQECKTPKLFFMGVGYGAQVVEFLEKKSLFKTMVEVYVNDLYGENLLDFSLYCSKKGYKNVHLIPGDVSSVTDSKLKNNQLDAVIAFNLFHYTHPKETIESVRRSANWLKDSGKLYMVHASYDVYQSQLTILSPQTLKTGIEQEVLVAYLMGCSCALMEFKGFNFVDSSVTKYMTVYGGRNNRREAPKSHSFYTLSDENWSILLKRFGLKIDSMTDNDNFQSKCFIVSKNTDSTYNLTNGEEETIHVLESEATNYDKLVREKIANQIFKLGAYKNSASGDFYNFCIGLYKNEEDLSNNILDADFARFLAQKINFSKEKEVEKYDKRFESLVSEKLKNSRFTIDDPLVKNMMKLFKRK